MYSVYLRWHDGRQLIEHQTRTGDQTAALAAYRQLLAMDALAGERVAAVLRDQLHKRTLLFSRFDIKEQRLLPDDAITWADLTSDADGNVLAIVAQRGSTVPVDAAVALLKAYRGRHGWTQPQAAAACGVPVSTWRGWEGGKPMPQHTFLVRLLGEALAIG